MSAHDQFAVGWQHHQADQYPQAEAAFREAIRADPGHADAWALLAETCLFQGKFAEAEAGYRHTLALRPGQANDHANLGVALAQQGKLADAVPHYREALRQQSDHVSALCNLGAALTDLDQPDEAVACLRQALYLDPAFLRALYNLGRALLIQDRPDEAEAPLREALRLQPDYARAYADLGIVLMKQGRHDEAVAHLRRAVTLQPDDAKAYNSLGVALKEQGKLTEAVTCLQEALRVEPGYAEAHKNLALVWLQHGDYERGWPEYEWRWRCKEFVPPKYAQPRWDGSDLKGRTVLLHTEQGLGDTIQFIRYAPLLQQRGGRVVVAAQPALVSLLSRCPGVDQVAARGVTLPSFDVYVPLLSLPALFGTTLATVPAEVPYLAADERLVKHWRRELAALPGFKVGIVWQGSPGYGGDRERSTRLACFEPLARLPGVNLLSLQKGAGSEQLAAAPFPVTAIGERLDDWANTAAVVQALDLLITVDTGVAHLAGALDVPVWVALPLAPDWRWLLDREDSPWYPAMRLFRQTEWGRWEPVFARLADALRSRVG
jgi:tetratricopeptide (TPR) repeat protein